MIPDSNCLGRMSTDTKPSGSCFGVPCSLCSISPSSFTLNLVRLLSPVLVQSCSPKSRSPVVAWIAKSFGRFPALCVPDTAEGCSSTCRLPRLLLVFPPTLWPLLSHCWLSSSLPFRSRQPPCHSALLSFHDLVRFQVFAHYPHDISQLPIFIFRPYPFSRLQVTTLNCPPTYPRCAKVPEAQHCQIKSFLPS